MKRIIITVIAPALFLMAFAGCSQKEEGSSSQADEPKGATVVFEAPQPLEVPALKVKSSDTDWEAIVHNKNVEVISLVNILNPVAGYLAAGFEQYGDKLNEYTTDDWEDTQMQLGKASALYEDCKKRMEAGEYNKQLFLDLEETWQLFVKVGVVGVRTQQMLNAELAKMER